MGKAIMANSLSQNLQVQIRELGDLSQIDANQKRRAQEKRSKLGKFFRINGDYWFHYTDYRKYQYQQLLIQTQTRLEEYQKTLATAFATAFATAAQPRIQLDSQNPNQVTLGDEETRSAKSNEILTATQVYQNRCVAELNSFLKTSEAYIPSNWIYRKTANQIKNSRIAIADNTLAWLHQDVQTCFSTEIDKLSLPDIKDEESVFRHKSNAIDIFHRSLKAYRTKLLQTPNILGKIGQALFATQDKIGDLFTRLGQLVSHKQQLDSIESQNLAQQDVSETNLSTLALEQAQQKAVQLQVELELAQQKARELQITLQQAQQRERVLQTSLQQVQREKGAEFQAKLKLQNENAQLNKQVEASAQGLQQVKLELNKLRQQQVEFKSSIAQAGTEVNQAISNELEKHLKRVSDLENKLEEVKLDKQALASQSARLARTNEQLSQKLEQVKNIHDYCPKLIQGLAKAQYPQFTQSPTNSDLAAMLQQLAAMPMDVLHQNLTNRYKTPLKTSIERLLNAYQQDLSLKKKQLAQTDEDSSLQTTANPLQQRYYKAQANPNIEALLHLLLKMDGFESNCENEHFQKSLQRVNLKANQDEELELHEYAFLQLAKIAMSKEVVKITTVSQPSSILNPKPPKNTQYPNLYHSSILNPPTVDTEAQSTNMALTQ